MEQGGDVFSALGWGLRKYAWVVVVFVVAFGALMPWLQSRSPDVYEAQAQVGPAKVLNLPNLTPLPKFAESVFGNGAVAASVRQELGSSQAATVVPDKVSLITAQDNIVFIVVGRDSDPETAQKLANLAASVFRLELNNYSDSTNPKDAAVGEFTVQKTADRPATPVPQLGGPIVAIGVGVAAGVFAGVGMVVLILIIRRPVLDSAGAEGAAGAPVLGRIQLPRGRGKPGGDVVGIASLSQRILAGPSNPVLLTSSAHSSHRRRALATALESVLGETRPVRVVSGGTLPTVAESTLHGQSMNGRSASQKELFLVDGPTTVEVATRPQDSLVLMVVEKGRGASSIRADADRYIDSGPSGVVLVSRPAWYRRSPSGAKQTPPAK